jgi:hypothetical protein
VAMIVTLLIAAWAGGAIYKEEATP